MVNTRFLFSLAILPMACALFGGASDQASPPEPTWGSTCAEKGVEWTGRGWRVWGESSEHSGNQYVGMKFPVEPFSPEEKGIEFRVFTGAPDTTHALYLRLYDAKGARIDSWCDWSFPFADKAERAFYLQRGLSTDEFRYETHESRADPSDEAHSVEIILGTKDKGKRFEGTLLNLEAVPKRYRTIDELKRPKGLLLETDLSDGVYLSLPEEDRVGDAIRAWLEEEDVQWKLWEEGRDPRRNRPELPILCAGQRDNNRLAALLYHNLYVGADDLYPGEGGFVLRTVHDPWGVGQNVVFLGGSHWEDCLAGLAELRARLGAQKGVSRCLCVRLGPGAQSAFGSMTRSLSEEEIEREIEGAVHDLAVGRHCGLTPRISQAGMNAYYGGGEGWARLYGRLMDLWYEHALSDPGTYGGRWGMDADFRLRDMVAAWDLVEEDPVFSEEDRLRMTRILFEFAKDCAPKARGVLGSKRIRHNHQTFPALGLYFAGSYFRGSYSLHEADEWLKIADACFGLQSGSWKPYEDCNGYQWLTLRHLAEFCAARPMGRFFEERQPVVQRSASEEAVRMCLLTMDNLGYQVPYGDCASPYGWFSEMPFLRTVASVTGDPFALWCVRRKEEHRPAKGLHACPVRGEGRMPESLLGVRVLETSPLYYESFAKEGDPPLESTFDKVSFRNSFQPADPYLLLDGLGNGGHGHRDVQAVLRYTDRDRIWLADCDYFKALPAVHNTLVATRDGLSGNRAPFSERHCVARWEDWSASSTRLDLRMGALWRRKILWLPNAGVAVLDEVEAREAGRFDVRALWQLLGGLDLDGERGRLRQGEEGLLWHWLGCDNIWVEEDWESGEQWKGYPHADPVVRRVSCQAERELGAGQSVRLWSVWGREESESRGGLLRDGTLLFSKGPGKETVLAWSGSRSLPLGIRCEDPGDALFWATDEALFGLGTSSLSFPGRTIAKGEGESFSFAADFEKALLRVRDGGGVERISVEAWTRGKEAWTNWFEDRCGSNAREAKEEKGTGRGRDEFWEEKKQLSGRWKTETAWRVSPSLEEAVLSATERQGALRVPLQVEADKPPREKNLFSGQAQRLDAVVDGRLEQTSECVLWPKNETVLLKLNWGEALPVRRVTLYAWFSSTSSKGEGVGVSAVGLVRPGDEGEKAVRWIEEKGGREDWGGAPHRPVAYEWELGGEERTGLSFVLRPWEERSVYVAETEVVVSTRDLGRERLKGPGWRTGCVVDERLALVDGSGDLFLLNGQGEILWSREESCGYLAVSGFDVNGDGASEVLAGGEGASLDCFDQTGELLWRTPFPRYKRDAVVRVLFPARLRSEGTSAAVAGTDSWRYYAVDGQGDIIWMYESVHRSTVGGAFDLDQDGREEVFLGTEYYWWPCVTPEGKRLWQYSPGSPKVCAVAAGDRDADGSLEVFLGGADGTLHALDAQGKCLWKRKTGDAVTGVICGDLDRDGAMEIAAGNAYGAVLCFDGQGEVQWVKSLHSPVTELLLLEELPAGEDALLVGLKNGWTVGLNGAGEVRFSRKGDGEAVRLEAWNDPKQETRGVLAVRQGEAGLFLIPALP